MKIFYHKRVRDRIPKIIAAAGRDYAVEGLSEAEFRRALVEKLVEEAAEVAAVDGSDDRSDWVAELADLFEVIDALLAAYGLERETVLAAQRHKQAERDGFGQRRRLLWAEVASNENG